MESQYIYAVDFYREDGSLISQAPLEPDWMPALEWVHFEGIRAGCLPPSMVANLAAGVFRVEPVWHATAGQPHVSAFSIAVPNNGTGVIERQIPTTYVRQLVQRASSALVERGLLHTGEPFRYLVSACAPATPAPRATELDFGVEQIAQPLPLTAASLESYLHGARPSGEHIAGDLPVFIPQAVLDETMDLAQQAGDIETGGVLIGHLRHDASVPEIFVEVTAQIPALHTEAATTKLTFTPDTWAAVHAAMTLRKRGERPLMWWHFHPDFCRLRKCPLENRLRCTAASAFFSNEDIALHTALFARAYNTALLISDSAATGLTASLFGWRHGLVMPRGFYTTQGEDTQHGAHHRTN